MLISDANLVLYWRVFYDICHSFFV